VAPAIGFSSLLAGIQTAGYHCPIQRHPSIAAKNAYNKALITLSEPTIFPSPVNGISLSGPYPVTFNATSDLVDPSADSADAGYTVAAHTTLSIDAARAAHATLPGIRSILKAGGADAGYTVAAHTTLSIDAARAAHATLPGIRSILKAGGTANIKVVTSTIALPKLTPALNPHS
jgi:hypothetical protein